MQLHTSRETPPPSDDGGNEHPTDTSATNKSSSGLTHGGSHCHFAKSSASLPSRAVFNSSYLPKNGSRAQPSFVRSIKPKSFSAALSCSLGRRAPHSGGP